jgi:hypothetical protein
MADVRGRRMCLSPDAACTADPTYTNAKVKPTWAALRPMEIPPWLWFGMRLIIEQICQLRWRAEGDERPVAG